MTWDIGAYEFGAAIPVPPDHTDPPDPLPIPIPIPTQEDVYVEVRADSGITQMQVVKRRKLSNILEVHVNKGTTVKMVIK